jgi:hypothetical protein
MMVKGERYRNPVALAAQTRSRRTSGVMIVGRGASLDTDQARGQLLEERQDRATLQLAADDYPAAGINSVSLEH